MNKEKMKATPAYDEKLGKWMINVMVNDEIVPVGRYSDETQIFFEHLTFGKRKDAIEWIKQKEDLYCTEVKFYAFNDYEYFALIAVDAEEKYPMAVAIEAYKEEVADIEDDEEECTPDEISLDEALEKYKKARIEGCNTEADKVSDFYKRIDLDVEHEQDYEIMLIDGSLI